MRKPVHLTLDEQLWTLAKERLPNVSRIVEQLLKVALFGDSAVEIVRIGDLEERGGAEPPTPGFPIRRKTSSRKTDTHKEAIGEIEPLGEANIFTETLEHEEAKPLLNESWDKHKEEFKNWIYKQVAKDTARDYYNACSKFFEQYQINEPIDVYNALEELGFKRNYANGLRNFYKFLEFYELLDPAIIEKLRKYTKAKTIKPNLDYYSDEEVKEIIKKALKKYNDTTMKAILGLLIYPGMRFNQAYRVLKQYKKEDVKFEDNVAWIDTTRYGKGFKNTYIAIFPAWFGEFLVKNYEDIKKNLLKKAGVEIRLRRLGIEAKKLRKWNANFLIKHGVSEGVIDFIQGRRPLTVGRAHYFDMLNRAKEEYKKVVGKFPML